MAPKLSEDLFDELYEQWLESRAAPCARCVCMGRTCTISTARTFKCHQCVGHDCSWAKDMSEVTLASGIAFPMHAPDWWAARVRAHERKNPVVHSAPTTGSDRKSRPAETCKTRSSTKVRKTRSTSTQKAIPKREGKKKARSTISREGKKKARSTVSRASPPATNPLHASARKLLKHAAKGILDALKEPTAPYDSDVEITDGESDTDDEDDNITKPSSISIADVDPTDLDNNAIADRLDTLRRQHDHYARQYARTTQRAIDITHQLNETFDVSAPDYERDLTIVLIHHAQEVLVETRIDGAYLDLLCRDIVRYEAALKKDGDSAEGEAENDEGEAVQEDVEMDGGVPARQHAEEEEEEEEEKEEKEVDEVVHTVTQADGQVAGQDTDAEGKEDVEV
ncbi:hypothetical protein C8Q79DRAFT_1015178 [Trametes meyenii]|nr:hypothetical protein C8Q79DRAFT_1015178 [Trametes meyenii]